MGLGGGGGVEREGRNRQLVRSKAPTQATSFPQHNDYVDVHALIVRPCRHSLSGSRTAGARGMVQLSLLIWLNSHVYMHEVAPERWDSPLRANCALMSSVRTEYYERKGVGRRERVRMMNDNDAHTQLPEEDVTVCACVCVRACARARVYVSLCECHCHWLVFSSLFIVFLQLSASGRMPPTPPPPPTTVRACVRACVCVCVCERARVRAKDTRQTDLWLTRQYEVQHNCANVSGTPQTSWDYVSEWSHGYMATAAGSIKEGPSPPHVLYY